MRIEESPQELRQFRNFDREIKKLIALYNATVLTFPDKWKQVKKEIYKWDLESTESVFLNDIADKKFFLAGNPHEFIHKLRIGFLKTQREVILIRAISALEVLLIDLIKEAFLHRKDLFLDNTNINFSKNELLSSQTLSYVWSKIINNECRKLKRFQDVNQYYQQKFSINFSNSEISLKDIQYAHDVRHLLVHWLWRTDSRFRHTYWTKSKKISITEEYFYNLLIDLSVFGKYVSDWIQNIITSHYDKEDIVGTRTIYEFKIKIINPDSEKIFLSDFAFRSEDFFFLLKDISTSCIRNKNEIHIILNWEKTILKNYIRHIKSAEKKWFIEIIKKHTNNRMTFTNNQLKEVRSFFSKGEITKEDMIQASNILSIDKKMIKRILRYIKNNKE